MFFNLLMAKAKKKAEYTELAYLESTGTQWIDTEIPFQPIKAVIEVCFNEDVKTRQVMGFSSYNTTYFGKATNGVFEIGGGITLSNTINPYEWHTVEFTHNGLTNQGICKLTVDGASKTRQAAITSNPLNFWLFNTPGYGTTLACHCKIRSAKFYNPNTNELISDFIPVLDKDLVPCMYDKVKGKYHNNGGTGEFKWRLPNQLECLESTGTQWIDTGIVGTENISIETGFEFTTTDVQYLFGSSVTYNTNTFCLSLNPLYGKLYRVFIGATTDVAGNLGQAFSTKMSVNNAYFSTSQIRLDDEVYNITTTTPFTTPTSMYLFAKSNNGQADYFSKVKVKFFKIYDNGVLIQYLIPVFDKTLTPCMYDLVSKKYFYNIGTGQFKGYFEDGSQLINYLESDGSQHIDSGVECTSDLKVEFKGACSTFVNAACCGGIDLTNNPVYFRHHWSPHTASISAGGHYSLNYWCQKDSLIDASVNPPYTLGEVVEVMVDPVNGQAAVNGTEYTFTPLQDGLTTGKNYGIFARIANTGAIQSRPSSFSYFKIHKKSNLVRCFVPVLDIEGTPCMYDTVKEKYYNDENGVGFTYGTQVNLFDPTKPSYVAGYISTNNNGNITSSTLTDTFYIPCKPNTTYLIKRTSYKEANQVWRVATTPTVPTVNMSLPHYAGGLINDLYLVIKSRETDKYLLFSEGRTLHTDDLSKFTVLEIEDNNSLIGS